MHLWVRYNNLFYFKYTFFYTYLQMAQFNLKRRSFVFLFQTNHLCIFTNSINNFFKENSYKHSTYRSRSSSKDALNVLWTYSIKNALKKRNGWFYHFWIILMIEGIFSPTLTVCIYYMCTKCSLGYCSNQLLITTAIKA